MRRKRALREEGPWPGPRRRPAMARQRPGLAFGVGGPGSVLGLACVAWLALLAVPSSSQLQHWASSRSRCPAGRLQDERCWSYENLFQGDPIVQRRRQLAKGHRGTAGTPLPPPPSPLPFPPPPPPLSLSPPPSPVANPRIPGATATTHYHYSDKFSPHCRYLSLNVTSDASGISYDPPGSVNWRNTNALPEPADNQGFCRAAWAFASLVPLEVGWNQSRRILVPRLSAEEILDCTGIFCAGASTQDAYEYLAGRTNSLYVGGVTVASVYPYTSFSGNSTGPLSCQKLQEGLACFGMPYFESPDQCPLGLILALQGTPVTVSLQADAPSFIAYSGGSVYRDTGCFSNIPNHAVTAVGYDLTGPVPYFIIRNTWGPAWGDQGYMRIEITAGFGICGMFYLPMFYPVIPPVLPCSRLECGVGECKAVKNPVAESGRSNVCASCPPFFQALTNPDLSQSCISQRTCVTGGRNPCGAGTCVDTAPGNYSCICPDGYKAGSWTTGKPTCVLDKFVVGGFCDTFFTVTLAKETCAQVAALFRISVVQLEALNPGLTCPAGGLIPGLSLCVQDGSRGGTRTLQARSLMPTSAALGVDLYCTKYAPIGGSDSCASIIAAQPGLNATELYHLNPGLNCDALVPNVTQGDGVNKIPSCLTCGLCVEGTPALSCNLGEEYTLQPGDTCGSIIETQFGGNRSLFESANANLSCCPYDLVNGETICREIGNQCDKIPNPCGVGTCKEAGNGTYTCVCPPGYKEGMLADGTHGCVPDTNIEPGQYCITFFTVTEARETCAEIAALFGITVEAIQMYNPGIVCDARGLNPGLSVCVEVANTTSRRRVCTKFEPVLSNDTCASIAAEQPQPFGLLDLYRYNPGLNCQNISALPCGLCVMGVEQQPCPVNYTVVAGDTCESIIEKEYNGSAGQLAYANQNFQCCDPLLYVGEQFCLYGGNGCGTGQNPCEYGTCVDHGPGNYTCSCPPGYKPGVKPDGTQTCVPDINVQPGGYCDTFFTVTMARETCEDIAQQFGLDIGVIEELNPTLDCSIGPLIPGTTVCLHGTNTTTRRRPRVCVDYWQLSKNDTCDSIVAAQPPPFSILDLYRLNPGLNCNNLTSTCGVCLRDVQLTCDSAVGNYTITANDTCHSIVDQVFFGHPAYLESANSGFKCCDNDLYVGEQLCRYPGSQCAANGENPCGVGTCFQFDNGTYYCECPPGYINAQLATGGDTCVPNYNPIPGGNCITFYTVFGEGETCASVAGLFLLNVSTLVDYNPGLDCSANLTVGEVLCVEKSTQLKVPNELCLEYIIPGPNTTCQSIIKSVRPPITLLELFHLNPGLNCNNLTAEACGICVSGTTQLPCPFGSFVVGPGATCQSLADLFFHGSILLFEAANQNFECCDDILAIGDVFCKPGLSPPSPPRSPPAAPAPAPFPQGLTPLAAKPALAPFPVPAVGAPAPVPAQLAPVPAPSGHGPGVCQSGYENPCGVGTCINTGPASYACVCPPGYKPVLTTGALVTCEPDSHVDPGLYCITFFTITIAAETCSEVADIFGITVSTLQSLNPELNCAQGPLTPGLSVCVEGANTTHTQRQRLCVDFEHVRKGDNCSTIVARQPPPFSLLDLYRLNPGLNCNNLTDPCGLCVRGVDQVPCPAGNFTVELGDTCASLAKEHYMGSSLELAASNQGFQCCDTRLYVGEELCNIPGRECQVLAWNPCGVGTCVNAAYGQYACVCPPGYKVFFTVYGKATCEPDPGVGPGLYCQYFFTVTVAQENCSTIAGYFNINATTIEFLNPGLNCSAPKLIPGLSICVKGTATNSTNHLLKCTQYLPTDRKSNCTAIVAAQPQPYTLLDLYRMNPGINCNNLKVACGVCVHLQTRYLECPAQSYFVRPGDTCWSIVQGPFYGFPRRLESANYGFKCCDRELYVGEEICLWQMLNPCRGEPCGPHGTCIAIFYPRYYCHCDPGYRPYTPPGGKQTCIPNNVCTSGSLNPCGVGTCVDDFNGGYTCICPPGYLPGQHPDGQQTCEPDCGAAPGLYCITFFSVSEKAETCKQIQSLFGLTEQQLIYLNPYLTCPKDGLRPGLSVCVEGSTTPHLPTCLSCTDYVPVSANSSCAGIVATQPQPFNYTTLYRLNPGLFCSNLTLTCGVCVMGKTPMACPANGSYAVQLGDTCKGIILHEFDNKPVKLERANWGLKCCDRALFVGEEICLYYSPNACDKKPCENGVCVPLPGNKFRCDCYPGFQLVHDGYGKPRCIRVNNCPAIGLNPCGVGTCTDQKGQPYSCYCPAGYIPTSHVDGSAVCAPNRTVDPGLYCITFFTVTKKRETCAAIAALFGLTEAQLHFLNPSLSCAREGLRPGLSVCVEGTMVPHQPTYIWCTKYVPITSNTTCQTTIAAQPQPFSLLDLYRLNPGLNCLNLTMACGICVKGVIPLPCGDYGSYTVKVGDSCQSIVALEFGGSARKLRHANGNLQCCDRALFAGEVICLYKPPTPCEEYNGAPNPCGNGTCVVVGTGYRCECLPGYKLVITYSGQKCIPVIPHPPPPARLPPAIAARPPPHNTRQSPPPKASTNPPPKASTKPPPAPVFPPPAPVVPPPAVGVPPPPPSNPCTGQALNPCGVGTCTPDPGGLPAPYTCNCPPGYKLGMHPDGAAYCVPDPSVGPGQYCTTFFTVSVGRETCEKVASLFGLTVKELQALNPGLKCSSGGYFNAPTRLRPGTSVCVATAPVPPSQSTCSRYEALQEGETCRDVQAAQPAPFALLDLFRLNPGLNCNNLTLPCGLCVAGAKLGKCGLGKSYKVKLGDSCASITASLFGGSEGALEAANPGFKCCDDALYVGFQICTAQGPTACDKKPRPCGAGECVPLAGDNYKCKCPPGYKQLVEIGGYGSKPTCAPDKTCSASGTNPCGVGVCKDTFPGEYECECPPGYTPAMRPTGMAQCIPDTYADPGIYCRTFFTVTQAKETCAQVAGIFGITLPALQILNPDLTCPKSGLAPLQTVCVEGGTSNSVPRTTRCVSYVNLTKTSSCASVVAAQPPPFSLLDLYRLNPGINCNNLTLPCGVCTKAVNQNTCGSAGYVSVRPGDTCSDITLRNFWGNASRLSAANAGLRCCDGALFVGERICLWGADSVPPAPGKPPCAKYKKGDNPCRVGTCVPVDGYQYKCECPQGYKSTRLKSGDLICQKVNPYKQRTSSSKPEIELKLGG